MKKNIPLSRVYQFVGLGPVVLISSSYKGRKNIMPMSWITAVDFEPPKIAVVIGDHSFTYKLITRSKELVINIPTEKMLKKVIAGGDCSGIRTDKWKKFGFTPLPSKKIRTPGIAECPVNIECRIVDSSLAKRYNLFILEAKSCTAEKGSFNKYFRVDRKGGRPLLYLGKGAFSLPGKVFTR